MPVYEYRCQECSHWEQHVEGFDAPATRTCERCGRLSKRNFSSVNIGSVPGGARSGELSEYVMETGNVEAIDYQKAIRRARREGGDPDFTHLKGTKADAEIARKVS